MMARRLARSIARASTRILLPAALGILWEKAHVLFGVPTYLIPPPSALYATLLAEFPSLLRHTRITTAAALGGFVLGNGMAVLLASLFLYSRLLERMVLPFALALRSVPLVALTPLFLLWLGSGFATKVVIVSIITFFPMLVNASQGLRSASPAALEMMHTLAANSWQVYRHIRLPSALPMIFAGLRITTTSAILGAVVAEYIGSNAGLGFLVVDSFSRFEFTSLWAAMAVSAVLAILVFFATVLAERVSIPWHEVVERYRVRVGEG